VAPVENHGKVKAGFYHDQQQVCQVFKINISTAFDVRIFVSMR
jgi:hypothetical protein